MQTVTLEPLPQARGSDPLGELGYYSRLLAPAVVRPVVILETVIGMALTIALCAVLRPSDPLLLAAGFPWIWMVPCIFALRYGALLGVLASLCVAGAWSVLYGRGEGGDFPLMFFAGGLAQVLIVGHFCDIWMNRAQRVKSVNGYLNERLVSITNSHYLLRISHERLEHDMLSRPGTLRDALARLRDLLPATHGESRDAGLPNAQAVLEFAALTCQLANAAIYPMTQYGFGRRAVASVGEPFELDLDDMLLRDCVEKGTLSHLREIDESGQSAYLVCVPVKRSHGLAGVLVVRRMPFLSLNFDNLQLLLVLLGYYADSVEQRVLVAGVRKSVPHCPYDFALELARLASLRAASGIESSLLALVLPRGPLHDSLFDAMLRGHRTLDAVWTLRDEQQQAMLMLMPLTGQAGIEGYLLRTESSLRSQFETDFAQARVAVHSATVAAGAAGESLHKLLERCGHG